MSAEPETIFEAPAPAGDTPPTQAETKAERLSRQAKAWWNTPAGQERRAAQKGKRFGAGLGKDKGSAESKDKAPRQERKAPVPKGSIAKGVAMAWGGIGWVVENLLGDAPVGQAMRLQKGMAGKGIDTFLKSKFPAAHVALYPILGEVGEWSDAAEVVKLPVLVGLIERMPPGTVPPALEQAVRESLVPVLRQWAADRKAQSATVEEVRALEVEAGITVDQLLAAIFPPQAEPEDEPQAPADGQVHQVAVGTWLSPE